MTHLLSALFCFVFSPSTSFFRLICSHLFRKFRKGEKVPLPRLSPFLLSFFFTLHYPFFLSFILSFFFLFFYPPLSPPAHKNGFFISVISAPSSLPLHPQKSLIIKKFFFRLPQHPSPFPFSFPPAPFLSPFFILIYPFTLTYFLQNPTFCISSKFLNQNQIKLSQGLLRKLILFHQQHLLL